MNLIKMGDSNISEIALEAGFNNPSYFSKCFQNRFGISPSKLKIASS
jgi:AraC-like DNA-binding protein